MYYTRSNILAGSKSLNVNALQSLTILSGFTPTPASIFDGHPAFSLRESGLLAIN
ncbi:MAG: hypothetical protein PF486_00035 [Prolixibacteraceae bacterium]|nr:hypothetical protein [Prolixibacteraceae bacterium]